MVSMIPGVYHPNAKAKYLIGHQFVHCLAYLSQTIYTFPLNQLAAVLIGAESIVFKGPCSTELELGITLIILSSWVS